MHGRLTTVAILGAESMLGRRIGRRLHGSRQVITIGRRRTAEIVMDLKQPNPEVVNGHRAETLIHCAASFGGNTGGGNIVDDLIENEMVNSVGCLRALQLAAAMGCGHFIYISSVSALPENNRGNSYGLSKRHGQENLELACGQLGIRLTTLLVAGIYDEYGEARKHQPMFYRIIDDAREARAFTLFGRNDAVRNFVFVEDLVKILELMLDCEMHGTYSVVHPRSHRLTEIVAMSLAAFGTHAAIEHRLDMPDIPDVFYPPDSTLYELVGYWPETSLETGLGLIRDHVS